MLSNNQIRFFDLIKSSNVSNTIMCFFDVEKRAIKLDEVNELIGQLSHGEQIMLMFFANVWFNANTFDFNLIDAASTLDEGNRSLIAEWLQNPFWP